MFKLFRVAVSMKGNNVKGKRYWPLFPPGDKNSYPPHQKPHRDSSDSDANHTICCGRTKINNSNMDNLWSPVQPLLLAIWFSTTFFRVWACFQSGAIYTWIKNQVKSLGLDAPTSNTVSHIAFDFTSKLYMLAHEKSKYRELHAWQDVSLVWMYSINWRS